MTLKRLATLTALAVAAFVASGNRAHASFNFMTVFDNVTAAGGTVTTIAPGGTFNGVTLANGGVGIAFGSTFVELLNEGRNGFFVPGSNTINVGDIQVQSTAAPGAPDSFTINYRDNITLQNVPPPGSAATSPPLPFTGTLTLSGISSGTGTISNAFTSPTSGSVIVGGVLFSGGITTFATPTVNGAGGNLGGNVTASAVPEPSSVALLGMGLVAGCGLYFRRNLQVRQDV